MRAPRGGLRPSCRCSRARWRARRGSLLVRSARTSRAPVSRAPVDSARIARQSRPTCSDARRDRPRVRSTARRHPSPVVGTQAGCADARAYSSPSRSPQGLCAGAQRRYSPTALRLVGRVVRARRGPGRATGSSAASPAQPNLLLILDVLAGLDLGLGGGEAEFTRHEGRVQLLPWLLGGLVFERRCL